VTVALLQLIVRRLRVNRLRERVLRINSLTRRREFSYA
jgi:hypothetical protein